VRAGFVIIRHKKAETDFGNNYKRCKKNKKKMHKKESIL